MTKPKIAIYCVYVKVHDSNSTKDEKEELRIYCIILFEDRL